MSEPVVYRAETLEQGTWRDLEHWTLRYTAEHDEPRLYHFAFTTVLRRHEHPDITAGTTGPQITEPWRVYRGRQIIASSNPAEITR